MFNMFMGRKDGDVTQPVFNYVDLDAIAYRVSPVSLVAFTATWCLVPYHIMIMKYYMEIIMTIKVENGG